MENGPKLILNSIWNHWLSENSWRYRLDFLSGGVEETSVTASLGHKAVEEYYWGAVTEATTLMSEIQVVLETI